MHSIEAVDLTKVFGSLVAVNKVSFTVEDEEIFGFLGPNGAGKTTTINMLTTVLKPSGGTAIVNGYDVVKNPSDVRRSIGVVHQEYTADEDLSGYENILLCAHLCGIDRGVAKKRAEELMHLVQLDNAKNRKVETYSGGMRRRLELASGLVNHPRLLFLDEPTLGLDVQTRKKIWEYIKSLKKEYDMAIFMTTHYLEEADNLCNRIAIIDHGKVVKIGTPAELKSSLGGDVIEVVVNSDSVDVSDKLRSLPKVIEVKAEESLYRIKALDGEALISDVIDVVKSSGGRVARVSLVKPTLDEVYLDLTGRSMREEQESWENVWKQRSTIRRARA